MHPKTNSSLDSIRGQIIALLPRLRRFAIALTGSIADGDDLVQDTVERALRNLHQWEADTRLDSWMFRIARNRFIDGRRASKREALAMAEVAGDGTKAVVDGERAALNRLSMADLGAAMQNLPIEQREAVALVLIDGASYRDAADHLGISMAALTSRVARARQSLAASIGD
jgi:RNA polymerase sigma factor (sigma-70 family)